MKVIAKFKKLKSQIEEMRTYDPWLKHYSAGYIMRDYLYCRLRYGVSLTKYEQYEFCRLNHLGRKSFVGERYGKEIWDVSNPHEARPITGDKIAFNKRFQPFLHRSFLEAESASLEEFTAFVHSVDRFIAKPFYGASGQGIEILDSASPLPMEELFQKYKEGKYLLEEVVVQHRDMAGLHPASLNTMRIATLRSGGDIRIMGAALRIGTGDHVVDNFHQQGIVAAIDLKAGVVKSSGINYTHQRFIRHPDTGIQIVGFQIPHWPQVVETVTEAARALPEMDYVGWDVAVDAKDNVLLIEGNSIPDYDVLQIASQKGLYFEFKPLIEAMHKEKGI